MEEEMIFLRKFIGRADGGCDNPRENFSNKGFFFDSKSEEIWNIVQTPKKSFSSNFPKDT